jgi:hypothetical protein
MLSRQTTEPQPHPAEREFRKVAEPRCMTITVRLSRRSYNALGRLALESGRAVSAIASDMLDERLAR